MVLTSKFPFVVVEDVVGFVVVFVVLGVVSVGGSVGMEVVGASPPEQTRSSLKMRLLMKGAFEEEKWTIIPISRRVPAVRSPSKLLLVKVHSDPSPETEAIAVSTSSTGELK